MAVTGELILQIGAALGGLAGLAAIINAVQARRRLGVEATEIIQRAASGVVKTMEDGIREERATWRIAKDDLQRQIDTMRRREHELEMRIAGLEQEQAHARDVNQMHAAWDWMAYEELLRNGTSLPHPPPLYPPPASRQAPRTE